LAKCKACVASCDRSGPAGLSEDDKARYGGLASNFVALDVNVPILSDARRWR